MAKNNTVTLSGFSELSLVEELLTDFLQKNGFKNPKYETARKLKKKIIPVLIQTTEEL